MSRWLWRTSKSATNAVYENGRAIAQTAATVVKATSKAGAAVVQTAYDHRDEISGAVVGAAKGSAKTAHAISGHVYTQSDFQKLQRQFQEQSRQYGQLRLAIGNHLRRGLAERQLLLNTLAVGGEALAAYSHPDAVPDNVELAYALAYPDLAMQMCFAERIAMTRDAGELMGLVSGVKGKLFEIKYTDYLNDGGLPDGFSAVLAPTPSNSGWDISVIGPTNEQAQLIQLKATDSATYVKAALAENPHIDVVTTSEVFASLTMQSSIESVFDGGISNADLTCEISQVAEVSAAQFEWAPTPAALALIAFSAYSNEGLSNYEKTRIAADRSVQSYLTCLCGNAVAIATQTWWLGLLGGVGSRALVESGRAKQAAYQKQVHLIRTNDDVLCRLQRQAEFSA